MGGAGWLRTGLWVVNGPEGELSCLLVHPRCIALARSSPHATHSKCTPPSTQADEVDSLLGQRNAQEHEATTAIKTEFMQVGGGLGGWM